MSYGFDMAFRHVNDSAEALDSMSGFLRWLSEGSVARGYIRSRITYSPAFTDSDASLPDIKKWLRLIFTVEFIYWPELSLLGVAGYYPLHIRENGNEKEHKNPYFCKPIYFQNSSDKDYDFALWAEQPDAIKNVVEECSATTLLEAMNKLDFDVEDWEFTSEELAGVGKEDQYPFRVYVYEKVFEKLALNDWLYSDKSTLRKFKMCALLSDYQENHLARETIDIAKALRSQIGGTKK